MNWMLVFGGWPFWATTYYNEVFTRILARVRGRVGPNRAYDLALDGTQSAFLRGTERQPWLHSVHCTEHLINWLCLLGWQQVAAQLRRRWPSEQLPAGVVEPPSGLTCDAPLVWQVLFGLPLQPRLILYLHYYQHMPDREIGHLFWPEAATEAAQIMRAFHARHDALYQLLVALDQAGVDPVYWDVFPLFDAD